MLGCAAQVICPYGSVSAAEMSKPKQLLEFAIALGLSALSACAEYRKCGSQGCPGDAEITAEVKALFAKHADLGPPNLIQVQTRDGVVYLTGQVATGLQKDIAGSIARSASGAKRVENSIAEEYSGR
jgi:osmotically-inducible protein OsmY